MPYDGYYTHYLWNHYASGRGVWCDSDTDRGCYTESNCSTPNPEGKPPLEIPFDSILHTSTWKYPDCYIVLVDEYIYDFHTKTESCCNLCTIWDVYNEYHLVQCDGGIKTWYKDIDGDGYTDGATLSQCTQPEGYKLSSALLSMDTDCDDDPDKNGASAYPGNPEVCDDGKDNDCDGMTDADDDDCGLTMYYSSGDGQSGYIARPSLSLLRSR